MTMKRTIPTTRAPAPEGGSEVLGVDEVAELLREIEIAERQIAAGEGIPHDEARRQLLERIGN